MAPLAFRRQASAYHGSIRASAWFYAQVTLRTCKSDRSRARKRNEAVAPVSGGAIPAICRHYDPASRPNSFLGSVPGASSLTFFIDRVSRLPRHWSNLELARHASLFTGSVVNVSAWQDSDKEGRLYKDYFVNASSYSITNYRADARGFQGLANEIFLDLESELSPDLRRRFDVVFNHTTLEHIYEARKALANLCAISKDVVILVLPFLQQYHGEYGDYWRFTPLAIKKMFEENGYTLLYQSFNSHRNSAVYTFTIASRQPEKWLGRFEWTFSCVDPKGTGAEPFIGCRAISNWRFRLGSLLRASPRRWWSAVCRLLRRP